jgi:ATP-dependent DNA helicase RecG
VLVSELKNIGDLVAGDHAVVYGQVKKLEAKKAWRSKVPMAQGILTDDTGSIKVLWFNQPYIAKMLPENSYVKMEGKVSESKTKNKKGSLSITNPEYERLSAMPIKVGDSLFGNEDASSFSIPVYPESQGITSKWIYHAIQKILNSGLLAELEDPLPADIRTRYHLPSLATALVWIHTPRSVADSNAARKRFSFEEVFLIQLQKAQERRAYEQEPSYIIKKSSADIQEFIERFPFAPTKAQQKAIKDILADFSLPYAMSRLLEGDVGSGKTAVAATTAYAVAMSSAPDNPHGHLQIAYMAPTEILAQQHFESFSGYFKHLPIQIGLITGSGCKKFPAKVSPEQATDISRAQLLRSVASGEITILIGTHALIQKTVKFRDLAYVIIDEQHRFGIRQRQKLARKTAGSDKSNPLPHLLSMTATPIPRTLALTAFGDLDLTLLDELPAGRMPVKTKLVPPDKRNSVYAAIRHELAAGRQAYVICPRIDEPDPRKQNALQLKSVTEEARRLKQKVFPNYHIGQLHGKMTPSEKEAVMKKFATGEIDILVATSVVEVGVNVPNATIIIIEGAERFGLSQLHQLRGRVQRSTHQAYCFLFTDSGSDHTRERLSKLTKATNGFALAEYDLELRGTGELVGTRQWGISDVGMEALRNLKMVEAARKSAQEIIQSDPNLSHYPALHNRLTTKQEVHLE